MCLSVDSDIVSLITLPIARYSISQNIYTLLPTDRIHLRFLDYHTECVKPTDTIEECILYAFEIH